MLINRIRKYFRDLLSVSHLLVATVRWCTILYEMVCALIYVCIFFYSSE